MPRITRGGPFESVSGGVVMKKLVIAMLTLVTLLLGPMGLAFAQVQVTSADPSSAAQGTLSLDVTVNGSGFDNSAGVKFLVTGTTDDGGITVRKVAVRNSKRLVVTIDVTDAATVNKFDIEVTLGDGRKGKGTTLFTVLRKINDPCDVAGLDFPAFTYRQVTTPTTGSIYVADASGKCSRLLFSVGPGVQMPRFSYPVDGTTNRGRVVWRDYPQIMGGDFVVSGTTVTVEPPYTILADAGGVSLELSPRGDFFYAESKDDTPADDPLTNSRTMSKISIANPQDQTVIKTITADDGYFFGASVNGDESALYVEEQRASGTQILGRELIRINLDTLQSTILVPQGIAPFSPAADPDTDRIAYTDYVAGSNNCYLLQIADGTTGATISYGQPRYGTKSTWHGGKVLSNGYKLAKGGNLRCDATGKITAVDAANSAETPLVSGYDPDGR
jgi:hypothetical protein